MIRLLLMLKNLLSGKQCCKRKHRVPIHLKNNSLIIYSCVHIFSSQTTRYPLSLQKQFSYYLFMCSYILLTNHEIPFILAKTILLLFIHVFIYSPHKPRDTLYPCKNNSLIIYSCVHIFSSQTTRYPLSLQKQFSYYLFMCSYILLTNHEIPFILAKTILLLFIHVFIYSPHKPRDTLYPCKNNSLIIYSCVHIFSSQTTRYPLSLQKQFSYYLFMCSYILLTNHEIPFILAKTILLLFIHVFIYSPHKPRDTLYPCKNNSLIIYSCVHIFSSQTTRYPLSLQKQFSYYLFMCSYILLTNHEIPFILAKNNSLIIYSCVHIFSSQTTRYPLSLQKQFPLTQ